MMASPSNARLKTRRGGAVLALLLAVFALIGVFIIFQAVQPNGPAVRLSELGRAIASHFNPPKPFVPLRRVEPAKAVAAPARDS